MVTVHGVEKLVWGNLADPWLVHHHTSEDVFLPHSG